MIDLQEGRAGFETIGNTYPVAENISRKDTMIAGIPCAWFLPTNPVSDDIVIYVHGGAFIFGSIDSHAPLVSHIAERVNRRLLVVDYHLAPEHPFPSGITDIASVIGTLRQENPQLRFGIIGDSAGGNLAMAIQLKLKETNGPKALYTVVISPWVNLECNTPSYERNKVSDIVLARPYLVEAARLYAAGHPLNEPLVSPVHGDFKDLAAVLIMVGTREILEDDSVQLQQQLQNNGVSVDLRLFNDQLHVWPFMRIHTSASQEALDDMAEFVYKHTLNNQ